MHLEENDTGSAGIFAVRSVQIISIGCGLAVILFLKYMRSRSSLIHE